MSDLGLHHLLSLSVGIFRTTLFSSIHKTRFFLLLLFLFCFLLLFFFVVVVVVFSFLIANLL